MKKKILMQWESGQGGFEWDDLLDFLTEKMLKKNPDGNWHAEVKGFGWQKLDGYTDFNAKTGRDFLDRILPDTDCTFKIYNDGKGFSINNFHHDSPTGEWYYIKPVKNKI